MKNVIAIIGICIEDIRESLNVQNVLHDFSEYVVARLGVPYKERSVHMISIIIDAPITIIDDICKKLENIKGVSAKTLISK